MSQSVLETSAVCYRCSKSCEEYQSWALHCGPPGKICCNSCMRNIFIVGTSSNAVGSVSCCPQHTWTAASIGMKDILKLLFDAKTARRIHKRMAELDSQAGKSIVCSNNACRATILKVERKTENLKVSDFSIPCTVTVVKTQAQINEKAQVDYEHSPYKPWTPAVPELKIDGGNDKVTSLVNQQSTSDTVCCKACWTETCVICKEKAHAPGVDCSKDGDLKQTIKLAVKMGWKRCGGCHYFFEAHGAYQVGYGTDCPNCNKRICNHCGAIGGNNESNNYRWTPSCGCKKTTRLGRGLTRLFTSKKTMEKKLFMSTPSAPKPIKE
ncbi:hypothetical protein BJ508DRAFT_366174 [Ascobolus immersus RN42]|uniref:RING-type domain-containing protein n=1 Tax=Ascobolus immersus RN42 TaxID=1160509 RepID=A0A3N4HL41_ASCIM|nr:hypothetical protein BJ508DRAFT_366174 [Ascobolus immersus RN42]